MIPFQKMVKIPQQNGTISGSKGSKFLNKYGTISEMGKNRQRKWYHFSQKRVKLLNKNGTISGFLGSVIYLIDEIHQTNRFK